MAFCVDFRVIGVLVFVGVHGLAAQGAAQGVAQGVAQTKAASAGAEDLVRCAVIFTARAEVERGDVRKALRGAAGSYLLAAKVLLGGIDSAAAQARLASLGDSAASELQATAATADASAAISGWSAWCQAAAAQVSGLVR